MRGPQLRIVLDRAFEILETSREELRDLDAAIGDGDLGITVGDGAIAVRKGLLELPEEADIVLILRTTAKHFASANPSTMSALVAGGLIAAARELNDSENLDESGALILLETATAAISSRGGAKVGDKTIVDALVATIDVMKERDAIRADVLKDMMAAAREAVVETAALRSQRGRAAWIGDRTMGHPDGGATAYLRFLEALDSALATDGSR